MKPEELNSLQELLEAWKNETQPDEQTASWLDARLAEETAKLERVQAPQFALEGEDRVELLETESMRLHNNLLTLRDRVQRLEEQQPPCCDEVPRISAETNRRESRMKGFLAGLVLAWLVVALGVFGLLVSWQMLKCSAELLGLSVPILLSLLLLALLAVLLQRKAAVFTQWLLKLLDTDEEDSQ